jgi:hypothetical protein
MLFGTKKTSFATNLNLVYRFKSIFLSSICFFSPFLHLQKGFCNLLGMMKWERKERECEQNLNITRNRKGTV